MFKVNLSLILFLIVNGATLIRGFLDPLSLMGAAAGLGALGYNYQYVKDHTYCLYKECCNDHNIPANIHDLKTDLDKHLFGQHIVISQLIPALYAHYKNLDYSQKPLVLSFHGTPGTGKNYVTDRIAKYLYKKGSQSKYVYKFLGRADFPLADQVEFYAADLKFKIIEAIKTCSRSLFIFDEVDKMPAGIFESITSLLEHHKTIYGLDFRKATFIFLSNNGGTLIAQELINLLKRGTLREDTKLYNFEKICQMAAYNVDGGLKKTSMIESSLIDHFLPFIPLEKRHVEKCIIAEFKSMGTNPSHEQVQEIANNYVTYENSIFSTYGCKRISKRVAIETAYT